MMATDRRLITRLLLGAALLSFSTPMAARDGGDGRTDAKVDTRVADAAGQRDLAAVRALLKQGADVNGAQGDGMTALHWAAEYDEAELAGVLVTAGAAPAAGTRIGGYTPLHVAAKAGSARVVRRLIDARADVNVTTTTGATPLHFAAASGLTDAIAALLDAGADVNAHEPQWGQTPLMFAAGAGRTEAVRLLLSRGADARAAGKVVDVSARNQADSAESRRRNARVAETQRQNAARLSTSSAKPASAAARPAAPAGGTRGADSQEEPEPLGYADLVGKHGGLTALLLAAREGFDDTVFALIDGGADIEQKSAADHTRPLLMATINGHFDLALRLLESGADVTAASDAGATPLYAALNMQWAPKSRHPQPTDYMQQQVGYLELARAFLDAGADPNARLEKSLWYTTYNRDLLGVDRTGATAFWLAAYTLDVPAMRLLLEYSADDRIPTTKVPERYEEGGGRDRKSVV